MVQKDIERQYYVLVVHRVNTKESRKTNNGEGLGVIHEGHTVGVCLVAKMMAKGFFSQWMKCVPSFFFLLVVYIFHCLRRGH